MREGYINGSLPAHNLGVMLDPELTFSDHINLVARKCYYQMRQLRVVSRSLTHQSTLTLVHAFVTSRIDCCSSLLVGLPLGTLPFLISSHRLLLYAEFVSAVSL